MDRKARKQNDTVLVALWKSLLFYGCDAAAAGLLEDMFEEIVKFDELKTPDAEEALVDDSWVSVREDAMDVLGDDDGRTVREWSSLFVSNRVAFRARAAEWIERCCEHDVFHLFD